MTPEQRAFWDAFGESHPGVPPEPQDIWRFGDSEALADELLALVLAGTKTATAGWLEAFQMEGIALPKVGDLSLVTDGRRAPAYVHETLEVRLLPFLAVDAAFAADEGEGDLSLEWWRAAHRRYFGREAARLGLRFSDESIVVCERFRVFWK